MKLDTCTNFDTRNSVMKPKYQKIQNLTPLVTSQSPGTKKGSKANNFTNNWNKKLKLDTCTNFDTRNSVMKPKYQKIQNLTPLVTSQSPGTKKGQKEITSQIIEIKSSNLAFVLIFTRGMQWWNRSFKNFKIWPR